MGYIERCDDGSFNINLRPGEIVTAVPGCKTPKFERYCSEFVYDLHQRYPSRQGYIMYNEKEYPPASREFFTVLYDKYAEELANRIARISRRGGCKMYHNFCYDDFRAPRHLYGLGKPRRVCGMFLYALMMHDKGPFADKFDGRLFGVRIDVWGNGSFTTVFEWD